MTENDPSNIRLALFQELKAGVVHQDWHWFSYHLQFFPPHPFIRSIVNAAVDCEERVAGLGHALIADLGGIGGIERHKPHYDQLMQKLAEIFVLRQLLILTWPMGTTFKHEPTAFAGSKRPELMANTPTQEFLFEVKTPSLCEHMRQRNENNFQVPIRLFDREVLDGFVGDSSITLPRDNPLKDFLVDANAKFSQFKGNKTTISVLIIVWDDFIYEPITVLTHPRCGLMTDASYFRDDKNVPIAFPAIDAVIILRHLMYFRLAAAEKPLLEREHAMDFGDEEALPNVWIPNLGGQPVPDLIPKGMRAFDLNDPIVARMAEYQPVELVLWE